MVSWYLPIYAETIIQDGDAAICLWVIEVIALVLEDCGLAEDSKAMGKASWDEELEMIVFCQLYCHMLSISRGAFTNIYGYIKDSAFYAADQLALSVRWTLEMQASHHAIAAH